MNDAIYKYSLPSGEIIKNSEGEEYTFGNLSDALYGTDELVEEYAGETINILLNGKVIEEVYISPEAGGDYVR